MTSPSRSILKPQAEREYAHKRRDCLMCHGTFVSEWPGERICQDCKKSVEWPLIEGDPLVVHTAKKPEAEIPELVRCPDFSQRLPEAIRSFTRKGVYDLEGNDHLSFAQGGGHGGSPPPRGEGVVAARRGGRPPYPNARQSANWTCVGLLAHQSAMNQGQIMQLPEFTRSP